MIFCFNKFSSSEKKTVPCTVALRYLMILIIYLFISCLQDELLKILGEKHRLYEFLNTFYVKCSYLLFNKEYVKAILEEAVAQKSAENAQRTQFCMNLLVVRARNF